MNRENDICGIITFTKRVSQNLNALYVFIFSKKMQEMLHTFLIMVLWTVKTNEKPCRPTNIVQDWILQSLPN